jgi:hypothetical protein
MLGPGETASRGLAGPLDGLLDRAVEPCAETRAPWHSSATRPTMDPVAPDETTLATADAGRAVTVAQLRSLADRLGYLALADVAEVLVLLEPALSDL